EARRAVRLGAADRHLLEPARSMHPDRGAARGRQAAARLARSRPDRDGHGGMDRTDAAAGAPDQTVAGRPGGALTVPVPRRRGLRRGRSARRRRRRPHRTQAPARTGRRRHAWGHRPHRARPPAGNAAGRLPADRRRYGVRLRGRDRREPPPGRAGERHRWARAVRGTGRRPVGGCGRRRAPPPGEAARITIVEIGPVDRITADALGEPGMRTFYLQARAGDELVTVVVEKEQVVLLSQSVLELLAEVPLETAPLDETELALGEPVDPLFHAGRLSIGYDPDDDRFLLEVTELEPDDEDEEDTGDEGSGLVDDDPLALALEGEPETIRLWASREQMLALSRHGAEVAQRGRPTCRFCGNPIDPE